MNWNFSLPILYILFYLLVGVVFTGNYHKIRNCLCLTILLLVLCLQSGYLVTVLSSYHVNVCSNFFYHEYICLEISIHLAIKTKRTLVPENMFFILWEKVSPWC